MSVAMVRARLGRMPPASSRSALRPHLVALGLLWGLPLLLVVGGYLVLPKDKPNAQCGGLGFGCSLSDADAVLLIGMLASPYLVAAGIVAVLLIAIVQLVRHRARRHTRSGASVIDQSADQSASGAGRATPTAD